MTGIREELATLIEALAKQTTCLKRSVVCIILDQNSNVMSFNVNHCEPYDGICPRLGTYQQKSEYSDLDCRWEHAEIGAIRKIPDLAILEGRIPSQAIVVGHDFVCGNCEETLKRLGIDIELYPTGYGTGLIQKEN